MATLPPRRRRASTYRLFRRRRPAADSFAAPSRRLSRGQRILCAVLVVLGFLVSGAAGAVAYFLPAIRAGLNTTGQAAVPEPSSAPGATARAAPTSRDPFTVLLLGSDNDAKFTSDHLLTQSMILVRVDPVAKHVAMLSIPRDLWVRVNGGGMAKIDTAFSDGGADSAVRTVEDNFRVRVDHYVWIGLKGLVTLIDQLGGVDVVTTNPVLDDFYPADLAGGNPYDYQRVAVLPGAQHMDGLHAMEYVRSRHGDLREDFGRSERQQQVLLALRAKAKQLGIADLPDIAASLNDELKTDMSIRQVADVLPLASGLDVQNVQRIVLLPPYTSVAHIGDQDVVLANWDSIRPLVSQTFPG